MSEGVGEEFVPGRPFPEDQPERAERGRLYHARIPGAVIGIDKDAEKEIWRWWFVRGGTLPVPLASGSLATLLVWLSAERRRRVAQCAVEVTLLTPVMVTPGVPRRT